MKTCYIVGAGEVDALTFKPEEEDFVIACDGGYEYCRRWGIKADLVIGDFDSLGFVPEHSHVVCLKSEKDDTDMSCAVKEGRERGFSRFVIYGGTGGRTSHTIANIQLLCGLAGEGFYAVLKGKDIWYRVICNEEVKFEKEMSGYLSVFCMGERALGVYEQGLKYSLDDAVLVKEEPLGVSNEFTGKESRVSVREGMLLLIGEGKENTL